jgi:hypothetical protein
VNPHIAATITATPEFAESRFGEMDAPMKPVGRPKPTEPESDHDFTAARIPEHGFIMEARWIM